MDEWMNDMMRCLQDDGHIFCLPDQIATEIRGVLDMVEYVMGALGFTQLEINLSTKPAKAVGSDEIWERAEGALREALHTKGWDYKLDEGGGAFYGPKIDVKIQDVLGRKWQCSTIQLDFNLPDRFQMVTHCTPVMFCTCSSEAGDHVAVLHNFLGQNLHWLVCKKWKTCPISTWAVSFAAPPGQLVFHAANGVTQTACNSFPQMHRLMLKGICLCLNDLVYCTWTILVTLKTSFSGGLALCEPS